MTTAGSPRGPPGTSLLVMALVILAIGAIPAGIGFIPTLLGISIPDKIAGTKIVRW